MSRGHGRLAVRRPRRAPRRPRAASAAASVAHARSTGERPAAGHPHDPGPDAGVSCFSSWYSASTLTARRRGAHRRCSRPRASPCTSSGPGCCTCACRCGRLDTRSCVFASSHPTQHRDIVLVRRRRTSDTPSACARRSPPRPSRRRPGRSAAISRLASSTRSSSALFHISSPSYTKYSRPRQVRPSFTMYGDHEPKFWIRPTFTPGSWM